MPLDILIIIFTLFTCATYLFLTKSLINSLCGFVIISNGANIFLLSLSGDPSNKVAPLLGNSVQSEVVDPLPQAMILTAIVIGLGLLSLLATTAYLLFSSSETKQQVQSGE